MASLTHVLSAVQCHTPSLGSGARRACHLRCSRRLRDRPPATRHDFRGPRLPLARGQTLHRDALRRMECHDRRHPIIHSCGDTRKSASAGFVKVAVIRGQSTANALGIHPLCRGYEAHNGLCLLHSFVARKKRERSTTVFGTARNLRRI